MEEKKYLKEKDVGETEIKIDTKMFRIILWLLLGILALLFVALVQWYYINL